MNSAVIDKTGSGFKGGTFRAIAPGESPEDYLWEVAASEAKTFKFSDDAEDLVKKLIEDGLERIEEEKEINDTSLADAAKVLVYFVRIAKKSSDSKARRITVKGFYLAARKLAKQESPSINITTMFFPFWPPFWWTSDK